MEKLDYSTKISSWIINITTHSVMVLHENSAKMETSQIFSNFLIILNEKKNLKLNKNARYWRQIDITVLHSSKIERIRWSVWGWRLWVVLYVPFRWSYEDHPWNLWQMPMRIGRLQKQMAAYSPRKGVQVGLWWTPKWQQKNIQSDYATRRATYVRIKLWAIQFQLKYFTKSIALTTPRMVFEKPHFRHPW